jgi:protein-disulfide isomerase
VSKKKRERKYGADEKQVAASGSEMTKFYWILGIVAVLGVGIIGYQVGSSAFSSTVSQPIVMEGLNDPVRLMEVARGVVMGNPDADITIIEFADFQCPACQSFSRSVKPLVEAEFIQPGTAKFMFYDFPLISIHPNAFLAARAARCAEDQGKFWEFHDVLFANQNRWSGQPNPAGAFEDYARQLGLERSDFEGCLRSDKHADVVTANMELAYQVQAPGTPTIMVTRGRGVGRRVDSSIEGIRQAVAALQAGG